MSGQQVPAAAQPNAHEQLLPSASTDSWPQRCLQPPPTTGAHHFSMSGQQLPCTLQSGAQLHLPCVNDKTVEPQALLQLPKLVQTPSRGWQVSVAEHLLGHVPPQPSPPHWRPLQSGLQAPHASSKSLQQLPEATQSGEHEQSLVFVPDNSAPTWPQRPWHPNAGRQRARPGSVSTWQNSAAPQK